MIIHGLHLFLKLGSDARGCGIRRREDDCEVISQFIRLIVVARRSDIVEWKRVTGIQLTSRVVFYTSRKRNKRESTQQSQLLLLSGLPDR